MLSVNKRAMEIVKTIIKEKDALNIGVYTLNNGSTVIDMGVNYTGGYQAAKHLVEITLGGLGYLQYSTFNLYGLELPQVEIYTDNPVTACLSCQLSGWPLPELKTDNIVPLISGPIRTIVKEDKFAKVFPYTDINDEVVVALQGGLIPDVKLTDYLASKSGVDPKNVYVLTAATGSLPGMVNVVARTLETSLWRLHALGFNPEKVISAWGRAPIPPIAKDEYTSMIRSNTFVYYGGTVGLTVDCDDKEITDILPKIVLSKETTKQYGIPFGKLLAEANGNIFEMRKFTHSVTKVNFYNIRSGNTFKYGEIDPVVMQDCLEEL